MTLQRDRGSALAARRCWSGDDDIAELVADIGKFMTLCEVFQIAADRSRVEGTMRDRRDLSEISENISGLQRIQTGVDASAVLKYMIEFNLVRS